MFTRDILQQMELWKVSEVHKPLILRGAGRWARQQLLMNLASSLTITCISTWNCQPTCGSLRWK